MSKSTYSVMMMIAAVGDIFNFFVPIPGQGDVVIFLLCLSLWVEGYGWRSKRMVTGLIIEAIPVVSALPGCCMFISKFYAENLKETIGQKV